MNFKFIEKVKMVGFACINNIVMYTGFNGDIILLLSAFLLTFSHC